MTWSNPTTRSSGYAVTATNWNEFVNNFLHLDEVGYTLYSSDVTVNATAVGTANQVVSSGAISYENVAHMIQFYCPLYSAPAQITQIILRDSTTVIGTIATVGSGESDTLNLITRITPTTASHTYNIAAWLGGAGTGTMNAGSGGTAGDSTTHLNGFIRIWRVPT